MTKRNEHNDFKKSKKVEKAEHKDLKQRGKEIRKALKKEAKLRSRELQVASKIEMNALFENWYKLDNAALIYPAIKNSEWNTVFRLTVNMKEIVDANVLQQALDDTMKRYPLFNVSLRNGLFWHYFQSLPTKPIIQLEDNFPCRPIVFDKSKQIFRVLYYNNTISYESFHSLTDGGGALKFFNTLIVRYCQLKGVIVKDLYKYDMNALDLPDIEESEDAFARYADGGKPRSRKEIKAYEIKGALEPMQMLYAYIGRLNVQELKDKAKEFNATINEFLSAVYLQSMIMEKHRCNDQKDAPIKLSIPVNLRKMFPSKTMRNFSQYINITVPIDKENVSLVDMIDIVKEGCKVLNKDYVMGAINANVSSERNFLIRITPLILKDLILNLIYNNVGERLFTSTISNLGKINLPPEIEDKIESYYAMLGATKLNKLNLTAVTAKDEAVLTFTTRLKDTKIIKNFFNILSGLGLNISIETNKEI